MIDRFKLAKEWQDFEAPVLPANAGDVQKIETRRAFYAGAAALFSGLLSILEPGAEATENDLKVMDSIKAELDQFAADLHGGVA